MISKDFFVIDNKISVIVYDFEQKNVLFLDFIWFSQFEQYHNRTSPGNGWLESAKLKNADHNTARWSSARLWRTVKDLGRLWLSPPKKFFISANRWSQFDCIFSVKSWYFSIYLLWSMFLLSGMNNLSLKCLSQMDRPETPHIPFLDSSPMNF